MVVILVSSSSKNRVEAKPKSLFRIRSRKSHRRKADHVRISGKTTGHLLGRVGTVFGRERSNNPVDAVLLFGVEGVRINPAQVGHYNTTFATQEAIGRLAFGELIVSQLDHKQFPAFAIGPSTSGRFAEQFGLHFGGSDGQIYVGAEEIQYWDKVLLGSLRLGNRILALSY